MAERFSRKELEWLEQNAEVLISAQPDSIDLVLERLSDFAKIGSSGAASFVVKRLAQKTGIAETELQKLIAAITLIAGQSARSESDEIRESLGVLRETLGQDGFQAFDSVVQRIEVATKNQLDGYRDALARVSSLRGVIPFYSSVQMTVELRGVLGVEQNDHLESGDFIGLEPVASVMLTLDSGTPNQFAFQVGCQELEALSDACSVALARMEEIRGFIK